MSRFFDPEDREGDRRLHAPATERNRDVILEVLRACLPKTGALMEVASGSGQHAAYFSPHFPELEWQPTDIEPHHLESINAWRKQAGNDNLLAARHLDVLDDPWPTAHFSKPLRAMTAINLIHIAPFSVTEALMRGAGSAIASEGVLYLYGPYKRGGSHTSESNEEFDASLKSRNPAWGVRDMETVIELGLEAGFDAPDVISMPANNFSLVFRK